MAAALLTSEPVTLRNLPDIDDVRTLLAMVAGLGVDITRRDRHTVTLRAGTLRGTRPDPELLRKIRGALVLMGPLLARRAGRSSGTRAAIASGGGAWTPMSWASPRWGQTCATKGRASPLRLRLRGADILLDEASVTATENVVLAAVRAEGPTVLRNAASEPHVQDLCELLVQMGARIDGIGSNVLTIHGGHAARRRLHARAGFHGSGEPRGAGGGDGGRRPHRGVRPADLRMSLGVFARLGISAEIRGEDLAVSGAAPLVIQSDLGDAIPKVDDGPWPAFPADLIERGPGGGHSGRRHGALP